jgi:hypothetical protein
MLIASLSARPCPFWPTCVGYSQLTEDRRDPLVRVALSAHHDRERPRLDLGDASGHRRVEHRRSERTHPLREVPADAGADRAHVDPDLLGTETGENPLGAGGDLLEHAVVGKGGEDDLRALGDFAWRVAPPQAVV